MVAGERSTGSEAANRADSMADCTNPAIRNIFRTPQPPPMLGHASLPYCLPGSPVFWAPRSSCALLCVCVGTHAATVQARAMHCRCRGRRPCVRDCVYAPDEIWCCGLLFRFADHAGLEKCEYRPDNKALYGKHLVRQTRGLGGSGRKARARSFSMSALSQRRRQNNTPLRLLSRRSRRSITRGARHTRDGRPRSSSTWATSAMNCAVTGWTGAGR